MALIFTFIYYFLAIVAIWFELWSIYNYDLLVKLEKEVTDTNTINNKQVSYKGMLMSILSTAYFVWSLIGVFTSQWILFICLLSLSAINFKVRSKMWNMVDAILSMIILLFIILNKYHLHID